MPCVTRPQYPRTQDEGGKSPRRRTTADKGKLAIGVSDYWNIYGSAGQRSAPAVRSPRCRHFLPPHRTTRQACGASHPDCIASTTIFIPSRDRQRHYASLGEGDGFARCRQSLPSSPATWIRTSLCPRPTVSTITGSYPATWHRRTTS